MKKIIFICVALFAVIVAQHGKRIPIAVEYYKTGDTLYPDYACSDTLVVVDEHSLNIAMAYIEQDTTGERGGDLDIDSTFHKFCITVNQ